MKDEYRDHCTDYLAWHLGCASNHANELGLTRASTLPRSPNTSRARLSGVRVSSRIASLLSSRSRSVHPGPRLYRRRPVRLVRRGASSRPRSDLGDGGGEGVEAEAEAQAAALPSWEAYGSGTGRNFPQNHTPRIGLDWLETGNAVEHRRFP
jgi:hypothetical protein